MYVKKWVQHETPSQTTACRGGLLLKVNNAVGLWFDNGLALGVEGRVGSSKSVLLQLSIVAGNRPDDLVTLVLAQCAYSIRPQCPEEEISGICA